MVKKKAKKKTKKKTVSNGDSARKKNGQFGKNNNAAKGHQVKNARKVQQLRKALYEAVTESDIKLIVKKLVQKAKKGDIQATREIFDRCMGKPEQPITGSEGGPVTVQIVDFKGVDDTK